MTPKRIQLRRTKGWRKPDGAVVVSRPSKWGNPFPAKYGNWTEYLPDGTPVHVSRLPVYGRRLAVDQFRKALSRSTFDYPPDSEIRRELAGCDLACWCPLDQPCHADVLLEVANS